MSVPRDESLAGRWSLDHLFVDQDGTPTLVEVKRSTDTRIRREVVGQMLDYAANSISYWSLEAIRDAFEERCAENKLDPEHELQVFLGEGREPEQFWKTIESKLKAGDIRMLFVADQIPRELQRIIEFLNEQMNPAEVLGVEVKQYHGLEASGTGVKTIVPRVIGQTAAAVTNKSGSARVTRQWDEASFFAELEMNAPQAVPIARTMYEWARKHVSSIWFGRGATMGSFVPIHRINGKHQVFAVWSTGGMEIYFQHYKGPFEDLALRRELMDRLNQIPHLHLTEEALTRRPNFNLNLLEAPESMKLFIDTFEWYLGKIESQPNNDPE